MRGGRSSSTRVSNSLSLVFSPRCTDPVFVLSRLRGIAFSNYDGTRSKHIRLKHYHCDLPGSNGGQVKEEVLESPVTMITFSLVVASGRTHVRTLFRLHTASGWFSDSRRPALMHTAIVHCLCDPRTMNLESCVRLVADDKVFLCAP